MTGGDTYCYLHLQGHGNTTAQLEQTLNELTANWRQRDIQPWGIWRGLFGVASNELLVMLAAAGSRDQAEFTDVIGSRVHVRRVATFEPTLRPLNRTPLERAGVYVFRFFSISAEDADDFVALSGDAWTTFEGADAYAAEPQGLFRQRTDSEELDMLLVTWYDSLASWQTSRAPAAEARERFARRHQLTRRTSALATMLTRLDQD